MRVGVVHTFASTCRCHVVLESALRELGHVTLRVDSEEVPVRASELAALDLVFDQTDTLRGEGVLRPVVRALLEVHGARCVGTNAAGCFRADDKVATRRTLAAAGLPVAPGVSVTGGRSARLEAPFPHVVKPSSEHRSRGVQLVRDEAEEESALAALGDGASAVIERFVEGRELAVSVVGAEVLPPVEWPLAPFAILDAAAKEALDPRPARLEPAERERLASLAREAFRALELADWARFDVRLDAEGRFFFLEANTKPSLEAGSPCLVAAEAVGLRPGAFVARLIETAEARLAR